ncbi:thioredoxin family protein [Sunxiuqinia indica]|uniref:thioredoxin family protein n=1 Tax=Sunxiuqinia indica TaxID=2692584 RepID=UPI00135BD3CE|nr:thioredoxin domain-containing protein [Sunxiuqinia indica]
MNVRKYLFVVATILISLNTFAQGIEFEHGTFAEALAKAKAENKMVFMDCYTTWCGPCKVLSKEVFPLKEVGDYFNPRFVSIKIDMEKGEGIELAKKYAVAAFPTLLFMDAEGKVVHTQVGSTDGPGLIEQAKIASDPSRQIGALQERYDNGDRDIKFLSDYVQALAGAYEMDKIKEVGAELIKITPPEKLVNEEAFFILMYSGALEFDSPAYNYLIQNKDKVINTEGIEEEDFEGILTRCYYNYGVEVAENGSLKSVEDALQATKEDYLLARHGEIESEVYSAYYIAHKEYDKWFDRKLKSAEEQRETNESRGASILIQTAYEVAVRKEFEEANELTPKAIKAVENLMKDDIEGMSSGYYCLACLYKKEANKEKALENINEYLAALKAQEKEADQRIIKLKEEIEAM